MRIPIQEKTSSVLMPGHKSVLTSVSAPEVGLYRTFVMDIQPGMTLDVSNRTISSATGQRYRVAKFFVKSIDQQIIKGELVITAHCGDYSVAFRLSHPFVYQCKEPITYTQCVQQLQNTRPAGL